MAQTAQQVLNANQALGQAQSPEQQLVALKQAGRIKRKRIENGRSKTICRIFIRCSKATA